MSMSRRRSIAREAGDGTSRILPRVEEDPTRREIYPGRTDVNGPASIAAVVALARSACMRTGDNLEVEELGGAPATGHPCRRVGMR